MIAPVFALACVAAVPVLAAASAACLAYESLKLMSVKDAFSKSAGDMPSDTDDLAHNL